MQNSENFGWQMTRGVFMFSGHADRLRMWS